MYQFIVKQPYDKLSSIKLLRKLSNKSLSEIKVAITENQPILSLDDRDDLEVLELPQWCEKVKLIYSQLKNTFENVIIQYSPAKGDEIKTVDEDMFYSLLELEIEYFNQEYD